MAGREPGVRAVIDNHLDTRMPVVIEGDFLDPALADGFDDRVRAVVIDDDEDQILANYALREPEAGRQAGRAAVSAEWSRWYATNSGQALIIHARPWDTLLARVEAVLDGNAVRPADGNQS